MQNSDYCANCGRPIDGPEQNFCPVCGQRTPVHRINWHFLGHELQHGIFHVDGGIIYSLRQLLTRPGHTIREYIRGRRVPHFKPVLMIMILGAVVTVLSKYLLESGGLIPTSPLTINEGARGLEPGSRDAQIVKNFREALSWMNEHLAITLIALIPFYAMSMRMAFRKFRREYNFPEWLVITCFVTAQALAIYGIFLLLRQLLPAFASWDFTAMMAAQIFTFVQLFRPYKGWKTFLRFSLGYVYYGMFVILLILVGVFAILIASLGWDAFVGEIRG